MFMLIEKDCPLLNGVMILMLSAKLQVEKDSEMARDLVMKIFMEANKPKSRSLDTSSKFRIDSESLNKVSVLVVLDLSKVAIPLYSLRDKDLLKSKDPQPIQTTNEHRSNRAMLESLAPSMAVEDNILDAWAEYLNFNERLCNVSSPLRAFLPTFVVIEEFKNVKLSADVRYNLFKDYMQNAIVKDQRWMNFKDIELV
nr:hypothetical protein [Tanacetum cinerariifolium]